MLIRDWFENVKCTRRSTAGYHELPLIGLLLSHSLRYALSSSLSLFLSLCLPPLLSSTMRAQIFMESSSSRARCIPLRSLARSLRSPACSRLVSFRFVSSRLEEAPGTRNVSISVTVDGVPSHVSRLWTTGQRFDTCATSPDLHTANNNILAASTQKRYNTHSRILSSARARSCASANFFNRARFH